MATNVCGRCDSVLSSNALNCPKCNYPTPKNQAECNECNAVLDRARHKYKTASNYVYNGNTSSSSCTVHVPCTNCGEPQPLAMTIQEFIKTVFNFVLAFLILVVISILYFKGKSAYDSYFGEKNREVSIPATQKIK